MRYLVTSALPYANGPIHFGHIAGVYLPADIYVRHLKLKGEKVLHISGSDEHGVAIMQNAQKQKVSYQEYVDKWHKTHKEVFDRYQIEFDFFGQTSKPYHEEETIKWFNKLYEKGGIQRREEKQLQCQDCLNYLPDRFVEGKCYECGYEEARGDECPQCGTWIEPLKLIDPVCKFCESKNVKGVDSYQWYLVLSKFHQEFKAWFQDVSPSWRKNIVPFINSLAGDELHDRAITRDLDWGIDVPLKEAKGKKIYVWFDAPIGYVSNTKELLKESSEDYLTDWWQNPETKIVNFIGKDNIIFHGIIFPVMSMASGFARPVDQLPANQYVNLAGKQFSKSKGWYIDALEAIEQFSDDSLRFYLTSLIPETADSSFTWKGFELKTNSELANNIGNFINRSMKFTYKNFADGLSAEHFEEFFASDHLSEIAAFTKRQHELIEKFQIKKAQENLMELGQKVNLFITERAPWSEFKTDPHKAAATLSIASVYVLILGVFFRPFLPSLSGNILNYFELSDEDLRKVYSGKEDFLKAYFKKGFKLAAKPDALVKKIDPDLITSLEEKLS